MENRSSANSARRILSSYKNRKADVSSSDTNDRSPTGIGDRAEHGHKFSEVYGFVGYVAAIVATVIFIIWAYVPDYWLQSIGIYYYPSRYWALAMPTYVMVTIVLAIGLYTGLDFLATPPPTSLKSIFDECSEDMLSGIPLMTDDEQAIEPISEIGVN